MALAFVSSFRDEVPIYRFVTSCGEGVINQHWPGLYRSWDIDPAASPFRRFGVNNNNGEEVVVYQGLAWALTEAPFRLAILAGNGHLLRTWFGRSPDWWSRWRFFANPEQVDLSDRDEGFRPSRQVASWPQGDGVYRVESREALRELVVASLSDAWGDLTILGFASETQLNRALETLGGETQPQLDDLLADGATMVHLVIGVDLGYHDSVFVAGGGLEGRVDEVAASYRRAAAAYERSLPSITSMEEFMDRLERLRAAGE